MRRKIIAYTILFSSPVLSASAQSPVGIREGQRVRITSPSSHEVVGVVREARGDSILLYTEPFGANFAIATSELRRVDVSRGRSVAEGARRGALWGGGIGAGFGLVVAASVAADDSYDTSVTGPGAAEFAANMAIGGLIWGAIIGAFVKAEKWDHASVRPRLGSSTLGLSVALP